MKPHPPNTQGRARRKHRDEQGHPEEAESHPEEAERRRRKGTEAGEERRREGWGDGSCIEHTHKQKEQRNKKPHKDGVGTLWPNLNRLSRLVPCGKGAYTLQ